MTKEDVKKSETPAKAPPQNPIKSIQYDLFSRFVSNDPADLSNTIEIWESIPKYFFTPLMMKKLRTASGLAEPFSWEYQSGRNSFRVEIQPASIKQPDKTFKAVFPSVSEEWIEEALKKFLSDQQTGIHDAANTETWVKFTLSMLYQELKDRGRERNRNQIKQSIEIMRKTHIDVFCNDEVIYSGNILSDVFAVNRERYLADADTMWIARLPAFISLGINDLVYRQYNYGRYWKCDEQLSRWLYKRVVNRFIQAGIGQTYHIMFTEISQSSGMLQMTSEQGNRLKVISCLEELKAVGLLVGYNAAPVKKGKKIVDTKYTLIPSDEFIKEQKAANKRRQDNHLAALQRGLVIEDKRR